MTDDDEEVAVVTEAARKMDRRERGSKGVEWIKRSNRH